MVERFLTGGINYSATWGCIHLVGQNPLTRYGGRNNGIGFSTAIAANKKLLSVTKINGYTLRRKSCKYVVKHPPRTTKREYNLTKTRVKQRSKRSTLQTFSEYIQTSSEISNDDYDIPKVTSTKTIRLDHLKKVSPLTDNQKRMFEQYEQDYNLYCHGSAGAGKTFLACYLALREILTRESMYEKLIIVRSPIATHSIGFLPGSLSEKTAILEAPYIQIFNKLINIENYKECFYEKLKKQGLIEFLTTAYTRGLTFDNAIIIVDEFQNLDFHSFDSVMTRIGTNTKILLCGDEMQTDLMSTNDIRNMKNIGKVLERMPSFRGIHFNIEDVVRSGLVKEYLQTKHSLSL